MVIHCQNLSTCGDWWGRVYVEVSDPFTKLSDHRTGTGPSSALNPDRAVSRSARTQLHAGFLESQSWDVVWEIRTWYFCSQLLACGCRSKMFIL